MKSANFLAAHFELMINIISIIQIHSAYRREQSHVLSISGLLPTHVIVKRGQVVAEGDHPEEDLVAGLVLGLVGLHQSQERLRPQRHLPDTVQW